MRAWVVFALFFGLQIGGSLETHDHTSVADTIECVVCHGVRIAPPAVRVAVEVRIPEPPRLLLLPEIPLPAIATLVRLADPPRGPPAS